MGIDPKLGLMTDNFNEIVSQYTKGLISIDSAKALVNELQVVDGKGTIWRLDYNGTLLCKKENQTTFYPAEHIPEKLYYPEETGQQNLEDSLNIFEDNLDSPAATIVQEPPKSMVADLPVEEHTLTPTTTPKKPDLPKEQPVIVEETAQVEEPVIDFLDTEPVPNFSGGNAHKNPKTGQSEWIAAEDVVAQAATWEMPDKPAENPDEEETDFVSLEQGAPEEKPAKKTVGELLQKAHVTINLRYIVTILFAVGMLTLVVLAVMSTKNEKPESSAVPPAQPVITAEQLQQTMNQLQNTPVEQTPTVLGAIVKNPKIKKIQVENVETSSDSAVTATLLIEDQQQNSWTAQISAEQSPGGQLIIQDVSSLTKN